MKLFFLIIKGLGKGFVLLIILLLLFSAVKHISCPVYKFKEGKAFSGSNIYNPYSNMNGNQWKKANFQIQSYAWKGITSGRGNTNEEIHSVYKSLGYDIIATSDYQKINRFKEDEPAYIPVYEHGYGIKKNHQVLIGSEKVLWTDFPLFQTLSNKQHILNLLRDDNELVIIAHPKLRHGYSPSDMQYLSNYDGIEVLNNYRFSVEHWDAALSSGNYVTIIGNDDAHDISNPDEIGHNCTFINSPTSDREDILKALKRGNSFGAWIYRPDGETFEKKIERSKNLPAINNIDLRGDDTIFVATTATAKEFRFVGQEGKILKTTNNLDTAFCVFKTTDTYIRTEIEFQDKTTYYLNPFCRMEGKSPNKALSPEIDIYRTWLLRILGFASLLFIVFNFYHFIWKPRKKTGNN